MFEGCILGSTACYLVFLKITKEIQIKTKFTTIEQRKTISTQNLRFKTLICPKLNKKENSPTVSVDHGGTGMISGGPDGMV